MTPKIPEIPPVPDDSTIPPGTKCQEASVFSRSTYVACGQPAVAIVHHEGERSYYMCLSCAVHNCRNRGGRLVMSTNAELEKRYKSKEE